MLPTLPSFNLASLQAKLIAALVIFVVGLVLGWKISSAFESQNKLDQVVEARKSDVASTEKSQKVETKAIEAKVQIQTKYRTITKEIIRNVPEISYQSCIAPDGSIIPTTLNRAAVGVLNGDFPSSGVQPASVGDAASEAPTEIGLRELSEHIAEVKQQYEELAADHDALVDYSEWYKAELKKQQ